MRESIGASQPPDERTPLEPLVEAARSQLDDAAWIAAWKKGWAMTFEEAVTYALEEDAIG